jgi:uncharacterized protein YggE
MNVKAAGLLAATLVGVFLVAAWTGDRQVPQESRFITVTGDADVRVVPDEVVITLGVETWDENLDVAKRQNDERVKEALAIIQEYGVEPEHIQTDYISIEPRYRDDYEKRDFIGFFVRKTIVITLKDISKFEDLLTSVLRGGVNYVHGIEFRTTELRKYRDEARGLAIQAAQEKAAAMAGALGQKVGKPHTIQENQSGWWSWYNAWWGSSYWGGSMAQNVIQEVGGASPLGDGSIAPGQITVNARVTLSFELD